MIHEPDANTEFEKQRFVLGSCLSKKDDSAKKHCQRGCMSDMQIRVKGRKCAYCQIRGQQTGSNVRLPQILNPIRKDMA